MKSNSTLIGSGQRSRDRQDKERARAARRFEEQLKQTPPVKK